MRLISIRLEDIRRFSSPVRVDGLQPGLNVLCAPNESGKSTLFDALQACFFQLYRSKGAAIAALTPHAGGAPSVTVEVETPEGRFEIFKRWLKKPVAEIRSGGRVIAKADEAEAWIAALHHGGGGGADAGPAGLLWVRQGATELDQNIRNAQSAELARRDLLDPIAAEVDMVTSGRRLDRVLQRCEEDLARYHSGTGRPKAGGPLALAMAEVEDLEAKHADLTRRSTLLRDDLEARRRIKKDLAELLGAEAQAERKHLLERAEADFQAAELHAGKLERARDAVGLAAMKCDQVADRQRTLAQARQELDQAARAARESAAALEGLRQESEAADATLQAARTADQAAEEAARAAAARVQRAMRAEAAAAQSQRRADLLASLARAEKLTPRIEAATRAAATGPDAKALRRLEAEADRLTHLRRSFEGAAPAITMEHAPGVRDAVRLDGTPLPEGRATPIPGGAVLDLEGLGRLTITPGQDQDDGSALRQAEAAFARALAELGHADMAGAAKAAADRERAAADLSELRLELAAEAPRGLDALRAEIATLPAPEEAAQDGDDPADVARAQQEAETAAQARTKAAQALEAARAAAGMRREARIKAEAAAEGAAARLARARAEVLRALPPDADSREGGEAAAGEGEDAADDRVARAEDALASRLTGLVAERDNLQQAHDALKQDAPDLEAARITLTRARSVCEGAERDIAAKRTAQAALDSTIDLRSGEGVEEDLADVAERLEAARTDLEHIRFEVAMLTRLRDALRQARADARDRTMAPVLQELRPLLRLLWPDAEIHFDDRILPTHLTRNGQQEEIDLLSGGTREQIAFLVRLAFARLLAGSGRHAPVILDDALIFTDDDRIEAMFDALHRQAGDIQILVLSCRQRAFRALGGTSLTIAPDGEGSGPA